MTQTLCVSKIVLLDKDDNCLVLRRSETHPSAAHEPDFPGGLIDGSESPTEAVVREVFEEAGLMLDAADCKLLYTKTTFEDDHRNVVRLLFACRIPSQKPAVTISWEHEDSEWVPLDQVLDVLTHPAYKEAIQYMIAHDLLASL